MKINDYKKIISETAIYPQEVNNFGKVYCLLGLMGEWYELVSKFEETVFRDTDNELIRGVTKEVGDVFWYMTALSGELNLDINRYYRVTVDPRYYENYRASEEIYEDLFDIRFTELAESFKKYYRDGKEIDTDGVHVLMLRIAERLSLICTDLNISMTSVLTENYNKLIKRRETNTLHGDGDNREESANA